MKNMVKDVNLDPIKIYKAISEGVEIAFWRMITGATDMPGHDFFDTIEKAAREAFEKIAESWLENESKKGETKDGR